MTSDSTYTNSERDERLKVAIELRAKGVPLTDIGKQIGYCKAWTCKLLKAAGATLPATIVDKNGTRRTKHGMRYSSEYSTWISMRTRCLDPNHSTYKRYGARGITLDPRWLDFHEFLADMGHKPSKRYTLERVDNDKGYCKENCIWLLKSLQNRNQSNTKLTMVKARDIRRRYAEGGITMNQLGLEYGVTESGIQAIIVGRTWKEIAA